MGSPQSLQKEEALVSLLDQGRGVESPGEVLRDMDGQEFEGGDPFDLRSDLRPEKQRQKKI